jgi:molybdopterin synthase catalytic subunit
MIRVQEEDFNIGAEIQSMTEGKAEVGALACFVGLVRDMAGDDRIESMTLEHYPGMTERQLAKLEADARGRWTLNDVLIVHRYGKLLPGDRIVLVATTSSHRQAALESCEFLIDWLKTKAPFWKKEETSIGARWVEAKDSDDDQAARWEVEPSRIIGGRGRQSE